MWTWTLLLALPHSGSDGHSNIFRVTLSGDHFLDTNSDNILNLSPKSRRSILPQHRLFPGWVLLPIYPGTLCSVPGVTEARECLRSPVSELTTPLTVEEIQSGTWILRGAWSMCCPRDFMGQQEAWLEPLGQNSSLSGGDGHGCGPGRTLLPSVSMLGTHREPQGQPLTHGCCRLGHSAQCLAQEQVVVGGREAVQEERRGWEGRAEGLRLMLRLLRGTAIQSVQDQTRLAGILCLLNPGLFCIFHQKSLILSRLFSW